MGLLTWAVGWALRNEGQELRAFGPRSQASRNSPGTREELLSRPSGGRGWQGAVLRRHGAARCPRGGRVAEALGQNALLLEVE